MKQLQISKNLSLPLNAATQKIACLGMTGSGKSYLQTKIVEFFLDNDVQTIYLDPKGEGWGLRLMADGKTPAFSIPIFGGEHGDYKLNHTMGKHIAELLVKGDYSAILDVSEFISSELSQFGYDFATRLFQLKKKKPGAMSLVIDEAQDFIPQNPQEKGYEQKMLGAFERIGKQLRSKGVGMVIAGQRPQEINKKVLNMCEVWFAFQMTGLSERETMEKIFRDKDKEEANKIFQVLPQLEVGQAHIWSPRFLKVSDNYNILPKKTLDTSATPEVGGKKVVARKLTQLDTKNLSAELEELAQKEKENDPVELKKKIIAQQKEITYLQKTKHTTTAAPDKAIVQKLIDKAVSLATGNHKKEATALANTIQSIFGKLQKQSKIFNALIDESLNALNHWNHLKNTAGSINGGDMMRISELGSSQSVQKMTESVYKKQESVHKEPKTVHKTTNSDTKLPVGELAVLTACAQFTGGVHRNQLTVLTGYKKSSRNSYVSRLKDRGYIQEESDKLTATSEGVDALGSDFELLPTGEALQEYWLKKLPEGEKKIFEILIAAHPESVDRDTITEESGYKKSSRDSYISRMMAKEIITVPGKGIVKASDNLFY